MSQNRLPIELSKSKERVEERGLQSLAAKATAETRD